jgi:hypothetical protein
MKQNICGYCNTTETQPGDPFCDDCKQFIKKRQAMTEYQEIGLSDYLLHVDHYEASPEISIEGIWGYHGEIKINGV